MAVNDIQICVLGDIAWQEVLVPDGHNPSRFKRHMEWIGAPLIRRMIAEALDDESGTTDERCFQPTYGTLATEALNVATREKFEVYATWDALLDACGQYSATLGTFPRQSRSTDAKDTALRVVRDLRAVQAKPGRPADVKDLLKEWARQAISDGDSVRRIVVIYDRGLFLSENIQALQQVLSKLTSRDALIVAIEGEVEGTSDGEHAPSTVDEHLEKILASVVPSVRDRAIVVLTADSLRKSGLRIVEYGHLEQAVGDVVGQLGQTPLSEFAQRCRHIVVSNQESALLHVVAPEDSGARGPIHGSIHICPNWDKLAQGDHARYGFMPGKLWIVLTAIVMKVHRQMLGEVGGPAPLAPWDLGPALRLAIVAFNRYARDGFDRDAPFDSIKDALSYSTRTALRKTVEDRERQFLISSLTFDIRDRNDVKWSRLGALIKSNGGEEATLYRIVEDGVDAAFRGKEQEPNAATKSEGIGGYPWFPGYAIDCPYAEFGDIKLIDEREITSFVSLSKLIEKYLRDDSWTKPLSIAVLGAHGSGKSFAVKEII